MSDSHIQIVEHEEEGAMDVILYLIKNDLPKAVVVDLDVEIDKLAGVKHFIDFGAYVQIEFVNKTHTNNAREAGFKYIVNGQHHQCVYATFSRVSRYAQNNFPAHLGVGF
ncbi:uncharacterized protein LOC119066635 [Bradysia coprophila]|uniref:uncharacterized protein LOC119066635 n=1 Tax=Bradysia coprophila TaxID=38358 RepID=UPI00187DD093|nr:uncharacterized protein LOC119066635 [Bradysia coprophila]